MRTKEELSSPEFNDDMSELKALLDKKGIEYRFGRHPGAGEGVKELIGYYPAGEWHIHIGDISVIRGMASSGHYEAYGGKFNEPERFKKAEDLIKAL